MEREGLKVVAYLKEVSKRIKAGIGQKVALQN